MSAEDLDPLPRSLVALLDSWIAAAGLAPEAQDDVRADVEQHFRDGLAAGRTEPELIAAFGDPRLTGPLLRSAVRKRPRGPSRPSLTRERGSAWGSFRADLSQTVRSLRAGPLEALTVVVVLALGLAADTLTLTLVNEVVLAPLPVDDRGTLVDVLPDVPGGNSFSGFSVADFEALRARDDVLVDLAATSAARLALGPEGSTERVVATLVSPGYFDMLGVGASAGSVSFPAFSGWGADPLVVVSRRFWTSRLGSDPGAVGSTIRIAGHEVTVLGIAAEPFTGTFIGFPTDVWLPLSAAALLREGFDPDDAEEKFLELVGRRRSGLSADDVDAALDQAAAALEQVYPDVNRGRRVHVVPLTGVDASLRAGVLGFVAILFAVSGLVLVVACLNVGGVLLARTLARERDLAIRIALGAGAGRMVRQLALETALLAAAGTGAALVVTRAVRGVVRDFVSTASGGIDLRLAIDGRVVLLTATAALLAALTVTLVPGLHVARRDPAAVLRQGRSSAHIGLLRRALVVGQVAFSVLLAVVTGLFARALTSGRSVDPGFDADRVASVGFYLDPMRYGSGAAEDARRRLLASIRLLPDVEEAALAESDPVGVGRSPRSVSIAGAVPPEGQDWFAVDVKGVGAGYMDALGIPLLAGRRFVEADEDGAARSVIVSEAFVRRFVSGEAVGMSIEVDGAPLRIEGVVADARYVVQDDTPDPLVYIPLGSRVGPRVRMVVRTRDAPTHSDTAIRAAVTAVAPDQTPEAVRTVRSVLDASLVPQRIGANVVGSLGVVALLLTVLGLYALVHHSVRAQTRTLGIRMALGGGRGDAVGWVLRSAFVLVGIGLALGAGLALLVTRPLRPFLREIAPHDPVTYLGVLVLFALAALLAGLGPALRASRIDPVVALRSE